MGYFNTGAEYVLAAAVSATAIQILSGALLLLLVLLLGETINFSTVQVHRLCTAAVNCIQVLSDTCHSTAAEPMIFDFYEFVLLFCLLCLYSINRP